MGTGLAQAVALPETGRAEAERRARRDERRRNRVVTLTIAAIIAILLALLAWRCDWVSKLTARASLDEAAKAWRKDYLGTLREMPYHGDFDLLGLNTLSPEQQEQQQKLPPQLQTMQGPWQPEETLPLPNGLSLDDLMRDLESPVDATYRRHGTKNDVRVIGGKAPSDRRAEELVKGYERRIRTSNPGSSDGKLVVENKRGKAEVIKLCYGISARWGRGYREMSIFLAFSRGSERAFLWIFISERAAEPQAKVLLRALKAPNKGALEYPRAADVILAATQRPSDRWVAVASSIHRIPQVDNDAELRQLRDQLPVLRQRMPAWANLLDGLVSFAGRLTGRQVRRTVFAERGGSRLVAVTRVELGSARSAAAAASEYQRLGKLLEPAVQELLRAAVREGGAGISPHERQQITALIEQMFRTRSESFGALTNGSVWSLMMLCEASGTQGGDLVLVALVDLGKAPHAGGPPPSDAAAADRLIRSMTLSQAEYRDAVGICEAFVKKLQASSGKGTVDFVLR